MLDTIIVGAIIVAAAIFVIRRLYRTFRSDSPACNCTGCGQDSNCPSKGAKDTPSCCTHR